VLGSDRALVGAEQPALEQARDAMNARHHNVGRVGLGAHDRPFVLVAVLRHRPVGLPPVGVDGRSGLHCALDERDQAVLGDIVDALQPNPPETLGVLDLDRDRDDRLGVGLRAEHPALNPTQICLIDLDVAR
jgi:hypothetical protein